MYIGTCINSYFVLRFGLHNLVFAYSHDLNVLSEFGFQDFENRKSAKVC